MDSIFDTIFNTGNSSESVGVIHFLIVVGVAIILGCAFAWMYCRKNRHSSSFFIALAVLPTVVCVVILMVNGNLGVGVAVAGAFSLVRFRSAQGSAKEICAIFVAMGIGLICGMGYIAYAGMFTVVMALFMWLLAVIIDKSNGGKVRNLLITIPEGLNYIDTFDDVFSEYLAENKLLSVKTTNMGSLYRLKYRVLLKGGVNEKEFIDDLRVKNGNLEISLALDDSDFDL